MTDAARTRFLAAYDAVLDRWPLPVDRVELVSPYGMTRVNAWGPEGDGVPLVLLHGGDATSPVWYANAAGLGRTRRVHAVDRIGGPGRSRRGDRPLRSVGDLHDWLDGVLDGVLDGLRPGPGPGSGSGAGSAAGPVDLCGHSYGAWIALTYALRAPQRVRRLVLLDPTQCFAGYRSGYLLRALPMLLRPTAERARAFLAWETGGAHVDPAWRELYGLAAEFPGTKTIVGRRPRPRRLRESTVPTLVLLAAASRAHDVRRVEAAARRHVPHVETAMVPGLSHHGIPFLHAAEIDRLIMQFLEK
ncbi:alpha/beta fold hydrolase [Streptomyces gilvosporeus]|uniref:alpha/beta fold hydrolase n=1 Tax=Streptomyces gilvosporeus TaxID=553510 RepID=UPI001F23CB58|nr:alpha/beta hydrolase [Streptomyces gilvosporeus]